MIYIVTRDGLYCGAFETRYGAEIYIKAQPSYSGFVITPTTPLSEILACTMWDGKHNDPFSGDDHG